MKIIFAPFVKLWNWIKETAWIQPLLIVGIVFAVIFSISPIISAVQGASSDENSTQAFYKNYRYSLEGIIGDEDKSKAGDLLTKLNTASATTDANKKAAAIKALPAEKFFLAFYKTDCSGCVEAKKGLDTLQKNWNSGYYVPEDKLGFKLVTIQVDEDVTDATTKKTGFDELLENYPNFFEESASNINESAYFINGKVDSTSLGYFESADSANFVSPAICLVDFTEKGSNGVSELLFSVPGQNGESGDNAKARTLIDCWNGTGDFEIK